MMVNAQFNHRFGIKDGMNSINAFNSLPYFRQNGFIVNINMGNLMVCHGKGLTRTGVKEF